MRAILDVILIALDIYVWLLVASAILSWLIFAGLLLGRHFRGWRGKIALRWTLAGFVALLLAYVGTRFVYEVILGRAGYWTKFPYRRNAGCLWCW